MYHIPKDLRAIRSSERITGALDELLRHSSLRDITVSRLCARSGVSRATFYRLFDNLTDVLTCRCDGILDAALRDVPQSPDVTARELSLRVLREWMCCPSLMRELVEGQHIDILYRSHMKYIPLFLSRVPRARDTSEGDLDRLVNHLCLLLPACLFIWQRSGGRESAEEVYDHFTRNLRILSDMLQGPARG